MASTATGTITEVIKAYKNGDADSVLDEFRHDARIVGTKKGEEWDSTSKVRPHLEKELASYTVKGPLTKAAVAQGELKGMGSGVMVFHRVGEVTFTGDKGPDKVQARWTVVLKEYAGAGWMIKHSLFSLVEDSRIKPSKPRP